jgi:hypothetical protein
MPLLFSQSNIKWPNFWDYLNDPRWRKEGNIQPQGLATVDLNGDKKDDLIFSFWQDIGYLNYGKTYLGNVPNRTVILLSGPDGYTDATNQYLLPQDQSTDGFGGWPKIIDVNADGYPDIWWIGNKEDGRYNADVQASSAKPSLFVFDSSLQQFKSVTLDLNAWWFYSGSFVVNGKTYFWGTGTSFPNIGSYFDKANPSKMIGGAAIFTYDSTQKTIIRESDVPSGGGGFIPVTWLNSKQLDYVVSAGMDTQNNSSFLGLWGRSGNTWNLKDGQASSQLQKVDYVNWSKVTSYMLVDPLTKLSDGAYLHPLTMKTSPTSEPIISFLRRSVLFGQPESDGKYYENQLKEQQFLEFWKVEGEKLVKLDIQVLNEKRDINTETSEYKDLNGDGIDDFITYPYNTNGSPVVYLGTGGNVLARVPQESFPTQPADWLAFKDQQIATSRFIKGNADDVWDLLIFPGQQLPNEWIGNVNANRTNVSASPVLHLGISNSFADAISDPINITNRLGSSKIHTFAGNDTIKNTNAYSGETRIDGGLGTDTCIYDVSLASSQVVRNSDGSFKVVLQNKATTPSLNVSTDTLTNVERLQFTNTSVAIDLNGNAGTTAKILGAVFGKDSVSNKSYVGIGIYFLDSGWTYDNLAGLALEAAGAKTNDQIVSLLWTNVIGTKPTTADKQPYIALLENGMTAGALAHLAADTALNTSNINLVGLLQTGIEYIPI